MFLIFFILAELGDSGDPPVYIFLIFFDGKIFYVHSSFFSDNGVRNKLLTKGLRRFFSRGIHYDPPLELQGLNGMQTDPVTPEKLHAVARDSVAGWIY